MNILVLQETDWIKRGPHTQHHLLERMSLRGHKIHVIDHDLLWKDENEKDIFTKEKTFRNAYKMNPKAKIFLRRPGMIKVPVLEYMSIPFYHSPTIKREIKKFKPDVIISFGILNAYIGMKHAKKNGIPHVYYLLDHLHTLLEFKPAQPIAKWFESQTIKGSDKIFVINEGLLDYAVEMGGNRKKGVYIPDGVEVKKYQSATKRDEVRKKFKVTKNETLLFFMGWLYDFTGMKEVCQDLIENSKKYPNIKIMIVGEGDHYNTLKQIRDGSKIGKKRIILTGKVPYEEISEYLSAADICLLPAHKNKTMENIVPIKLYEYLAAGKPVIATDLKGIRKEFGKNNGLIYVKGPKQVLGKVGEVRKDYEMLRKRGLKFVKDYDWDEITNQFEKELEKIS